MSQVERTEGRKKSRFDGFLNMVEQVGNKIPDPIVLFVVLTAAIIIISFIGSQAGWSAIHPKDGSTVKVFNLLSSEGIQYMFSNVYQNFVGFSPFAIAISVFLAMGVITKSGLLDSWFINMAASVSSRMLTVMIVFIGVESNIMGDIGFIVMPPLAAMLFVAMGRNPIVGMCCAYAAASCGLSANLVIGLTDARLAANTEVAAQIIDPKFIVSPTCNWYFIAAATFVLTAVASFVTETILEPHAGKWNKENADKDLNLDFSSYKATPLQKHGMKVAGISAVIVLGLIALAAVPSWGALVNAKGLSVFSIPKTMIGAIVTTLIVVIMIPGMVYGRITGSIPNVQAFGNAMSDGFKDIAPFAVMCFFAGQFTAWFAKSNLAIILAVHGANLLKNIGLKGLPLMLILLIFFCLVNLFLPSANAKWAIMAPIFVPMLMLLGYHPALTEIIYRMGDSTTNAITPVLAYFAVMLGLVRRYDKNAGIGTVMSLLVPYTFYYFAAWAGLFAVWYLLGLPLGPGGPLFIQ